MQGTWVVLTLTTGGKYALYGHTIKEIYNLESSTTVVKWDGDDIKVQESVDEVLKKLGMPYKPDDQVTSPY